jgi:hypothetical protein
VFPIPLFFKEQMMTSFPIDLSDAHILVNDTDQRVGTWQRGDSPLGLLLFANKTLAQEFHREVLQGSPKWRAKHVEDVADFLEIGVYVQLPNGSDMFLRKRVPQTV